MKLRSQIGENAMFIRDELERNYVCVQAGDYETRRDNIAAMPSAVPRRIEASLLETARKHPAAVGRLLGLDLGDSGLSYAGAGTENTTVTDGEKVFKIYRKSVHWTEGDQIAEVHQYWADHRVMREYLPDFVVPETTYINDHPLRPGKLAVITEQAYYDFVPTNIFTAYQPEIDEMAVDDLEDEYPGANRALGSFAVRGLLMYQKTGLLVDSSGFQNIVMADRDGDMRLTCLDGTPVKQNNESVAERIVGQLTALRDYVT